MPTFIFAILGLVIVLIIFCAVYYRIYKSNINRALEDTTNAHKPMPAPFRVTLGAIITFLILTIGISFTVGIGVGYHAFDKDDKGQIDINTIYARITDIDGNISSAESMMTVETIERNYEPYQEKLTVRLYEGLVIERNNKAISVSDLQTGDFVAIVFLTDLGGTEDVFKIELLEQRQRIS